MEGILRFKRTLAVGLFLFFSLNSSIGLAMSMTEIDKHLPQFSHGIEKEIIEHSSFDGLGLKVLRVGPSSGQPVLALTGYASNLSYYLPTAVELVKSGKTVYLLSPRGLGAGIFQAQQTSGDHRFNLQSMSSDLFEVMKMISARHPNEKLISMGHSLGGIINRLAALGIAAESSGNAFISQHRKRWYYDNVKLQVFASSPAPIVKEESPQSIEDALKFLTNSVHQLHYRKLLKPIWGFYLNMPFVGDLVKAPLDRMGSKLNNFHELIDSRLLKTQEFKDFVFHGVADKVPTELMLQLY
jgi:pimeloyl-ACP methyl ester carboxylesterase